MATIRAYTTIEQSHKLAEILPLESADMHYGEYCAGGENYPIPNCDDDYNGHCCWSLAALLNILPDKTCVYKKTYKDGRIKYQGVAGRIKELILKDNPVDACVNMIIKFNELNLL